MLVTSKILLILFCFTSCVSTKTFDDSAVALNIGKIRTITKMLNEIEDRNAPWDERKLLLIELDQLSRDSENLIKDRAITSRYEVTGGVRLQEFFKLGQTVFQFGVPFCLGMVLGPVLCPKTWLHAIYKRKGKYKRDEEDQHAEHSEDKG